MSEAERPKWIKIKEEVKSVYLDMHPVDYCLRCLLGCGGGVAEAGSRHTA